MMQAVAVPTRIGFENAVQVLEALRAASASAGSERPALDLAALNDFDSSVLSLLLHLVRERKALDGQGQAAGPFLLNPSGKLRALADLYGVDEMLFGASTGLPEQERPA